MQNITNIIKTETIGIFDSGIGGLSVLNALKHFPFKKIIYVADTAHLPYGEKSVEFLQERAIVIVDLLKSQGIKTVVIACHTSSTTTLELLKTRYPDMHFIDMLAPTITAALGSTRTKKVGVIATHRTIATGHHKQELLTLNTQVTVFEQACPQFVPLLENNGQLTEIKSAINEYVSPLMQHNIDTLILGCTHYAFLKKLIQEHAPKLKLISAADCVESMVRLAPHDATQSIKQTELSFFVSGSLPAFKNSLDLFFEGEIDGLVCNKF